MFSGVSDDGPGFEEMLALAAEHFPPNDEKPMDDSLSYPISAPSPFTGSSGSSSTMSPRYHNKCNKGRASDSDSDVEPLCLDNTYHQPLRAQSLWVHCSQCFFPAYSCSPRPTLEDDAPFLPHKRSTVTDTTSHLQGTTSSLKRRAGVRHAASHPPPMIAHTSPPCRVIDDPTDSTGDPDHDADDESDGNATDDEYVPSPAVGPLKRRRDSGATIKRSAKPSPLHVSSNTSQRKPTKRARVPPPSRNKQTSSAAAIELAVASKNPTFICPECGWIQTNQRVPDFKRHLLTHTRSSENTDKGWWCKGVLVKDAAWYGIPKIEGQYLFRNECRVGGCLRTFSRRDALKRHLDNSNVTCIGRPCEAAEEF